MAGEVSMVILRLQSRMASFKGKLSKNSKCRDVDRLCVIKYQNANCAMFINCDLHVASSDNRVINMPGSISVHVVLYVHMCLCLFPSLSLPCG